MANYFPGNNVGVLSTDQLTRIKEARRKILESLPIMDKAESCGQDCQGYRQAAAAMDARLEAYQREFGG